MAFPFYKQPQISDTCLSWKIPPVRMSLAGRTSTGVKSPASFSSISCTHNSSRRVTSLHLSVARKQKNIRETLNMTLTHIVTLYCPNIYFLGNRIYFVAVPWVLTTNNWLKSIVLHINSKYVLSIKCIFNVNLIFFLIPRVQALSVCASGPLSEGPSLGLNHSEVPQSQVPAMVRLFVAVHFDSHRALSQEVHKVLRYW